MWMVPEGKCKDQRAFSDINDANLSACTSWGSTCVSEGTKCIDKGTCFSYLIFSCCDNEVLMNVVNGLEKFQNKAASSDIECLAQVVKSGLCKLMKVSVPRSACVYYQNETAITTGQDKVPSVFDQTVEAKTRTKSYQYKEYIYIKAFPKKVHVLMNSIVQNQDMCACYKNKLSCKSRGFDGPTVADPNDLHAMISNPMKLIIILELVQVLLEIHSKFQWCIKLLCMCS
ncbi:unnamed protein product [Paramecium primaurelia]|uniref:Uncharacterized protein n=1 Tax=Paramecium primaurelia TaxID=5886 RepID=A0A8S1QQ40_PARPR|nr:unnamed protein product [Paramecium primaurelia]